METMGAEGASIISVTEAVADLLPSNTMTANCEVVPAVFSTALSRNADVDQAADLVAKAQEELNVGADWEHDQEKKRPEFREPTVWSSS